MGLLSGRSGATRRGGDVAIDGHIFFGIVSLKGNKALIEVTLEEAGDLDATRLEFRSQEISSVVRYVLNLRHGRVHKQITDRRQKREKCGQRSLTKWARKSATVKNTVCGSCSTPPNKPPLRVPSQRNSGESIRSFTDLVDVLGSSSLGRDLQIASALGKYG